MNSKIIKISILIIVMLFFAGLFNSVFGVEFDINNYKIIYELEVNSMYTLKIGKSGVEYNFARLTFDNITVHDSYPFNNFVEQDIDTYTKIYGVNFNNNKLYCAVLPLTEKGGLPINYLCLTGKNGSLYCGSKGSSFVIYEYNFESDTWNYKSYSDSIFTWFNFCVGFDNELKIYDSTNISSANVLFHDGMYNTPEIELKTVRTGTKSGYVEFIPKYWNSPHMYYIKDDMDELVRLIAEEELSVIHPKVKYYDGPVDIEVGEFVMGMLFDDDGNMIFCEISDGIEVDYDVLYDKSHNLYLDKNDEDTYYLSIHGYQEGDYVEVSTYPKDNDAYSNHMKVLDFDGFEYNGLQIGALFENGFGHKVRKIKLSKNGITYFNLYDKDGNFINTCVLNSSNYYSGEDFDFDVDLSFGNNKFDTDHKGLLSFLNDYFKIVSATEVLSRYNHTSWVKVKPTINVPSLSNYELYIRISDYGTIAYIEEEDRNIFMAHDNLLSNNIGCGIGLNSNTEWHRIDNLIYDYFYIATLQDTDANFTFELQLRSKSNQVLETKTFNVNLSASNSRGGLISSATDGKNDTYVRDPSELANGSLNSNNFNFDGLNSATDLNSLKNNLSGMLDNSIGFFSLISTFLLLLPTWVSSLIYFFLFGIIVITLYRFVRGA